jgi:surface protein
MFVYCTSLTSLDVSEWNTAAVTNMSSMFNYCTSLTSLDVSGWDFSKVTSASNISSVFRYCHGLHGSITIPSSITQIGTYFFRDTRSLYEYHFLSTTPPALANTNAFSNMTDYDGKVIYVPYSADHSILAAYQSATNWSTYASYMQEESA